MKLIREFSGRFRNGEELLSALESFRKKEGMQEEQILGEYIFAYKLSRECLYGNIKSLRQYFSKQVKQKLENFRGEILKELAFEYLLGNNLFYHVETNLSRGVDNSDTLLTTARLSLPLKLELGNVSSVVPLEKYLLLNYPGGSFCLDLDITGKENSLERYKVADRRDITSYLNDMKKLSVVF